MLSSNYLPLQIDFHINRYFYILFNYIFEQFFLAKFGQIFANPRISLLVSSAIPTRQKRLCDNLKKLAQKFVTQKFLNVTEATQKSTTLWHNTSKFVTKLLKFMTRVAWICDQFVKIYDIGWHKFVTSFSKFMTEVA